MDGERDHHLISSDPLDAGEGSLACEELCTHQKGWLPCPDGAAEEVCVSRFGEGECPNRVEIGDTLTTLDTLGHLERRSLSGRLSSKKEKVVNKRMATTMVMVIPCWVEQVENCKAT